MRTLIIVLMFLLLAPAVSFAEEADPGEKLYNDWCAQCHGYEGDGRGYASGEYTLPQPRAFNSGVYKFRTTPSGEPPLDEDIIRSTRHGNPGTSMPPWYRFTDEEVSDIIEYIKYFEEETFEIEPDVITIGKAPEVNDGMLTKGKEIFDKAKCWECHGKLGRGDGEKGWQDKFRDDWGFKIYPTNLSHAWELRNGATVEDIYRSITTGLDGTPMASYESAYSNEDRWALSHYVYSMQLNRNTGSALSVKKVDTLPAAPDDEQWNTAGYIDLPMGGQLMFEPRQFTPTILNMRVKGLYTESEIAIMLEWSDKKPDNGNDGKPSDAVQFQLPVELSDDSEKPYFFLGDKNHEVNLWKWTSSSDSAVELNSKGHTPEKMIKQEKNNVSAVSSYTDGLYRVVFKRAIDSGDESDVTMVPGKFIPFSIAAYDGQINEEGNRAAVSAWYYIMLEPPTPLKVYVMPPVVAFAFIGASMAIRNKIKKQS